MFHDLELFFNSRVFIWLHKINLLEIKRAINVMISNDNILSKLL